MSYSVPTLLLRNLHDVFGEIDPVRRRAAVDEIFHEDAVFHEPNGTYRGRDEIDRIAGVIKARPIADTRPATSVRCKVYDTSLRGSASGLLRNVLGFLKTLDYRRIVRRN